LAVFVASAIWHGVSLTYLAWGVLTAFYQIVGGLTLAKRNALWEKYHISDRVKFRVRNLITLILFVLSSVLFRSYGFRNVLANLSSMVHIAPLPEEAGLLGLSFLEWGMLLPAWIAFIVVQKLNQTSDLETAFLQKNWGVRYACYLAVILLILVFGTYGFGYDAQAFIYGGF
ncbi:MAG: hypothetical protein J6S26_06300, partial [Solobacterium sp.]|nr:hypothetical protein [Solobacterium sp.]